MSIYLPWWGWAIVVLVLVLVWLFTFGVGLAIGDEQGVDWMKRDAIRNGFAKACDFDGGWRWLTRKEIIARTTPPKELAMSIKVIALVSMVDSHSVVVDEAIFNDCDASTQAAICEWADAAVLRWQERWLKRGLMIDLGDWKPGAHGWPAPLRHGQGEDAKVPYALAYEVEANGGEDLFSLAIYDTEGA